MSLICLSQTQVWYWYLQRSADASANRWVGNPGHPPCAMLLQGWMIEAVASPCRISNGIRSAHFGCWEWVFGAYVYEQVVLAGKQPCFFFGNCWPGTWWVQDGWSWCFTKSWQSSSFNFSRKGVEYFLWIIKIVLHIFLIVGEVWPIKTNLSQLQETRMDLRMNSKTGMSAAEWLKARSSQCCIENSELKLIWNRYQQFGRRIRRKVVFACSSYSRMRKWNCPKVPVRWEFFNTSFDHKCSWQEATVEEIAWVLREYGPDRQEIRATEEQSLSL